VRGEVSTALGPRLRGDDGGAQRRRNTLGPGLRGDDFELLWVCGIQLADHDL